MVVTVLQPAYSKAGRIAERMSHPDVMPDSSARADERSTRHQPCLNL
jgi:hypothetical protein